LREQGIPARLLLIGDGPERSAIEMHVAAAGLGRAVIFAGRQADVVPWLSAFDVGILTSTAIETFSLAALEFMALGVPGVLSDIGGANEMICEGQNGHLFPVGDTAGLVKALAGLGDRCMLAQMGIEAAARVRLMFGLDAMVDRYTHLLTELVT
jgi:glycosyltransferase involved in cell wall biosynthesis